MKSEIFSHQSHHPWSENRLRHTKGSMTMNKNRNHQNSSRRNILVIIFQISLVVIVAKEGGQSFLLLLFEI